MINAITHSMIAESTETFCPWLDQPDRLAMDLYPDSPPTNGHAKLSAGDVAALSVYHDLERFSLDHMPLPEWLESDGLEDYLAARAVQAVIMVERTREKLRG